MAQHIIFIACYQHRPALRKRKRPQALLRQPLHRPHQTQAVEYLRRHQRHHHHQAEVESQSAFK